MGETRFDALTDDQKHCLRLAAQGYSSKEIARPLGVHHRTIDQRLDRARKLLDEPNRLAAARAWTRYEAGDRTYDPVICDPPQVASPPVEPEEVGAIWGPGPTPLPDIVCEAPASVSHDFDLRLENAPERDYRNGLSPLLRLIFIVAMVVGLVLAIVAAPALYDSVQRFGNSIAPPE